MDGTAEVQALGSHHFNSKAALLNLKELAAYLYSQVLLQHTAKAEQNRGKKAVCFTTRQVNLDVVRHCRELEIQQAKLELSYKELQKKAVRMDNMTERAKRFVILLNRGVLHNSLSLSFYFSIYLKMRPWK